MLSGYRIMWILVMFDLPVKTKKERDEANHFRKFLLDLGFMREQLSVYMRFCTGYAQIERYAHQIEKSLPEGGKVSIMQLTDKQFGRTLRFWGRKSKPVDESPDLFVLI